MLDLADAEELAIFRGSTHRFIEREVTPHAERRRKAKSVDRDLWRKAGEAGLLLAGMPAEYRGAGGNFRREAVIIDELTFRPLITKEES
jgi:acyl-CoA dehydrogenase